PRTAVSVRRLRPPPSAALFPYTTLFRSQASRGASRRRRPRARRQAPPAGSDRGGSGRATAPAPMHPTRTQAPSQRSRSRDRVPRSEEHTSELQSRENLVCRLLLEKKKHI